MTSTTIIELIVKQRDIYRTPSLLVTHRLQDAFTLCTHRFDTEKGAMVPLPDGETDPNTTFLMLDEGRLIFDGSIHELVSMPGPVREGVPGVSRVMRERDVMCHPANKDPIAGTPDLIRLLFGRPPKDRCTMALKFQGLDFLNLDAGFTEDELLVRRTTRDFVEDNLIPIIEDCFREGRFPRELVPMMGELGFFGANLQGYGCAGMSNVEYGLVMQELERGDSGFRSFVSVQSALVMYPIYTFGSDEQKEHLAAGPG